MPLLHSNPNVIVAADRQEADILHEEYENGALDGFQLWVHDFVVPDGAVGIPVYVPRGADHTQITPALIEDGITKGPLYGWALYLTQARHGHDYNYGYDVGSTRAVLRAALIEDGRVAPNRRAAAADAIRRLVGRPVKYDLWRPRDLNQMR